MNSYAQYASSKDPEKNSFTEPSHLALAKDFQISIKPTLFGWAFLALWIFAILLAATTNNNSAYMASFFLSSTPSHLTRTDPQIIYWGSLPRSLTIHPQFAGNLTRASVILLNKVHGTT